MDDVPWHLVAIVFITFAIWVRDRIRQAAEWRRQRKAERNAADFSRHAAHSPPQETSPYLAEYQEEEVEEEEIPKTFRELFEEIQQQSEPEEVWVEPTPQESYEVPVKAPPPLPDEIPAADTEGFEVPVSSEPIQVRRRTRRSHRRAADSLSRVLRDNGRLQTAIILKEVLDKPKALQEDEN